MVAVSIMSEVALGHPFVTEEGIGRRAHDLLLLTGEFSPEQWAEAEHSASPNQMLCDVVDHLKTFLDLDDEMEGAKIAKAGSAYILLRNAT